MKKKLFSSLLIFLLLALAFISCENAKDKTITYKENNKNINKSNLSLENCSFSVEPRYDLPIKEEKKCLLKQFERMKNKSENLYYNKKTLGEIFESEDKDFTMWDDKLNEIGDYLGKNLNKKDYVKLKEEEKKWVVDRKIKAHNAANKLKSQKNEQVVYTKSLIDSTRKRCYEIVNKYMN
ncbi:lysozyme inhibitor LprI family protein [Clostridium chrysemydis]|uniref:lysozyme inhibitor LprI family protein n=1 Tax=Clostridium chrysemydis TaxID=2665504 RepID=UPI0018839DE3|nr:lysozyme inhibitor LprI family protein [Clostridium chrysemydis]